MEKGRLEAFSDGVLAIIITVMVLELKVPHGSELRDLVPMIPTFLCYVLSFVYIAIYWNNHHHLLRAAQCVNGKILWANMHLLFWLSLVPFATGWMGENHFAGLPVAVYGFILLAAGIAYYILTRSLLKMHGPDSILAKSLGKDFKGKISPVIYILAIIVACKLPWLAEALYVFVAIMWLVPDSRIEHVMNQE
jgi:uncharacterized membrane protein